MVGLLPLVVVASAARGDEPTPSPSCRTRVTMMAKRFENRQPVAKPQGIGQELRQLLDEITATKDPSHRAEVIARGWPLAIGTCKSIEQGFAAAASLMGTAKVERIRRGILDGLLACDCKAASMDGLEALALLGETSPSPGGGHEGRSNAERGGLNALARRRATIYWRETDQCQAWTFRPGPDPGQGSLRSDGGGSRWDYELNGNRILLTGPRGKGIALGELKDYRIVGTDSQGFELEQEGSHRVRWFLSLATCSTRK
jgi:hypothetical protein